VLGIDRSVVTGPASCGCPFLEPQHPRASLIKAGHAGIVVRGEEFISVHLTDEACPDGLDAAPPEEVEVPVLPGRARPRQSCIGAP